MTKDEIINKIRKIQALAQFGTGGEKDAAEQLLAQLMEKYNISLADLNEEEKEIVYFYKFHGHYGYDLFKQVCAVNGCLKFAKIDNSTNATKKIKDATKYQRPRGANVVLVCTPVKFIEISTAYEIYQKSFDEHVESLMYAFLSQNDLFVGNADPNKVLTEEEKRMLERASIMKLGVDKAQVNKQLGTGLYLTESNK